MGSPQTWSMNTTTYLSDRWTTVRDELRERRQARAEYRALERDLESYNTRAQVDDLLASISNAEGPGAEHVRQILARNLQRNRQAS